MLTTFGMPIFSLSDSGGTCYETNLIASYLMQLSTKISLSMYTVLLHYFSLREQFDATHY